MRLTIRMKARKCCNVELSVDMSEIISVNNIKTTQKIMLMVCVFCEKCVVETSTLTLKFKKMKLFVKVLQ